MYYYKVYNFTIQAQFPINELIAIPSQKTDISITEGHVLSDLNDIISEGDFFNGTIKYQVNSNKSILLFIKEVGYYYVVDKNKVVIERLEGVTDADIALYLLGTCFAYIVMLNGGFALHGSAIKIGDGCVIFTGNSGAGKSTTAARLIEKGYSLLSDDVCVITFDNHKKPIVHPAYPQLKLWDNSVEKLGYDKNELKTVSDNWAKFRMSAKEVYQNEALPLLQVFELMPFNTNEVRILTLNGFDKVKLLLENTYRNFVIPSLNLEQSHFQFCTQLAKQITVKRIERPHNQFLLEELIDTIELNISNSASITF